MTLSAQLADEIKAITATGQELCDAIAVRFGPRETLAKFFVAMDAYARTVGVYIRFHKDVAGLADINDKLRDFWAPLFPAMDPRCSDLDSGNSYWLSAHSIETDRLVAVCAARRLDLNQGSLLSDLRSMRFLYRDPKPYLARGAECIVDEPAAGQMSTIAGVSVFTGAQWTDPVHRGKGIVYILGRINRNLALTRWDTTIAWGLTRKSLMKLGVMDNYGFLASWPRVALKNSYRGDSEMDFVWMDRSRIEDLLAQHVIWLSRELEASGRDAGQQSFVRTLPRQC